jgi:foldase protein PrsA
MRPLPRIVVVLALALALGSACGTTRKSLQSNDILARDATFSVVSVKHILIGEERHPGKEGDDLAVALLGRVRKGEPIEPLMREFSEDPGSAASGQAYEVTPQAKYVPEFKDLALRLELGEAGLVLSKFGWHVMKRVK